MDIFNPSVKPTIGSDFTLNHNEININFGDGYSQDSLNGLNSIYYSGTLSWSLLSYKEYLEIDSFARSHFGGVTFLWTLPHEDTPRKWKIDKNPVPIKTPATMYYSTSIYIREKFYE